MKDFTARVTTTQDVPSRSESLSPDAREIHMFLLRALLALGINARPADLEHLASDLCDRWTVTRKAAS